MKKVVILDKVDTFYEPYDRQFIALEAESFCRRNSSILRNVSMTSVWKQGYREGKWENHCKWVSCVSFEIDEITDAKWDFLHCEGAIGSYAVVLEVLPDNWETTPIFPSTFLR